MTLDALALAALLLASAPAASPAAAAAPAAAPLASPGDRDGRKHAETEGREEHEERETPAEEAAEHAPAPVPAGVARHLKHPPPGAPADLALWRRAQDTDLRLQIARAEATRIQARAAAPGWAQRLEAAAAGGALQPADAAALRDRVHATWREVAGILSVRWRVDPTRGCRYPFLAFDNLVEMAAGPERTARLPEARGRLTDCIEKAEPIAAHLAAANAALEESLDAAERALAAAGHPPPAAPALAEAR